MDPLDFALDDVGRFLLLSFHYCHKSSRVLCPRKTALGKGASKRNDSGKNRQRIYTQRRVGELSRANGEYIRIQRVFFFLVFCYFVSLSFVDKKQRKYCCFSE